MFLFGLPVAFFPGSAFWLSGRSRPGFCLFCYMVVLLASRLLSFFVQSNPSVAIRRGRLLAMSCPFNYFVAFSKASRTLMALPALLAICCSYIMSSVVCSPHPRPDNQNKQSKQPC